MQSCAPGKAQRLDKGGCILRHQIVADLFGFFAFAVPAAVQPVNRIPRLQQCRERIKKMKVRAVSVQQHNSGPLPRYFIMQAHAICRQFHRHFPLFAEDGIS